MHPETWPRMYYSASFNKSIWSSMAVLCTGARFAQINNEGGQYTDFFRGGFMQLDNFDEQHWDDLENLAVDSGILAVVALVVQRIALKKMNDPYL